MILAVAVIATVGGLFKIEIFGGIAGGLFGPLLLRRGLIGCGALLWQAVTCVDTAFYEYQLLV